MRYKKTDMIKFIFHIIASLICFTFAHQAMATELVVGISTGYPPYYYERDGKLTGICIDLVNAVAQELNIEVRYEVFPWKRLLSVARKGDVDAIMPLFRTEEREEFLHFDGLELAYETISLFTMKGFPVLYNGDFETISSHRIGVIAEYSYGNTFDSYQHFDKVVTENEEHLFKMFKHRRFDIGVGNKYVLQFFGQNSDLSKSIVFLEPPITKELLYLAFSKSRLNKNLAVNFAKALAHYRESRKYRETMARYGLSDNSSKP